VAASPPPSKRDVPPAGEPPPPSKPSFEDEATLLNFPADSDATQVLPDFRLPPTEPVPTVPPASRASPARPASVPRPLPPPPPMSSQSDATLLNLPLHSEPAPAPFAPADARNPIAAKPNRAPAPPAPRPPEPDLDADADATVVRPMDFDLLRRELTSGAHEPVRPAAASAPAPVSTFTSTPAPGSTPAPPPRSQAPATPPTKPPPTGAPPTKTPTSQTLQGVGNKLPPTDPTDDPIRQVGRYLVRGRLGRGGMATVYRATDPSIGRDVAIKFLHASLAEDTDCRARFLRESRAAGGLSHPNIVVVYDVGEIDSRPYMAMELVDGRPLDDVLVKGQPLALRDVVEMGIQLARALAYAHERGIVHRDVKPGNIMLLRDGRTVKVTDFGIAHVDDGAAEKTQLGEMLGTPQYMSPEQATGAKIDRRSDLFSAGVVLYQMVTGSRPFRGETEVATVFKVINEPHVPVADLRPDVPASLRRVIDRCLAKAPAQRYQSGEELADALAKVLAEMDEAVREQVDKPRIVPLRIKWALAMTLVVAVVMGITATIVSQRQYAAMMAQAIDYGSALTRFIARQNAAAALGEEWEVVDVAVQDMMKTGDFERIVVVDPAGRVRVSTQPGLVDHAYRPPSGANLAQSPGDASAVRYRVGGETVLGFEAPITFKDKVVGRIALGIPEEPLTKVARLSITLMIGLALVTVAAVALATYVLGNRFAKPIRLMSESLGEIAAGRFSHRIAEKRKDEFGQLYADFDAMAQALEARAGGRGGGDAAPAHSTPARTGETRAGSGPGKAP
jgi:serine/threonine-protein kinase